MPTALQAVFPKEETAASLEILDSVVWIHAGKITNYFCFSSPFID
jgi:hypothetical protein